MIERVRLQRRPSSTRLFGFADFSFTSSKPADQQKRAEGAQITVDCPEKLRPGGRARADAKRKTLPVYATLPRQLLGHPPIRHRRKKHDDEANRHHLSSFEFAIAAAIVAAARYSTLAEDRHAQALAAGQRAIAIEKGNAQSFKEDWRRKNKLGYGPTPKRESTYKPPTFKPGPLGGELRQAGRHAYKQKQKQLRRQAMPPVIKVVLTRSGLLRRAGLATDGTNLRRLDRALCRLTRPIGVNKNYMEPVLRDWDEQPPGPLMLSVTGKWLERPFAKLPMPLPTRSPSAMALFLFLHFADTGIINKTSISLAALCGRLGIPTQWGAAASARALDDALKIVNHHLKNLDADVLSEARITLPEGYEIEDADGRIRFRAIPRRPTVEETLPDWDTKMSPEEARARWAKMNQRTQWRFVTSSDCDY